MKCILESGVFDCWDYYPFGMLNVGRNWSSGTGYRYGFNGQEKDDELSGNGNVNTAEFWEYDSRLGRRWNIDMWAYASESQYSTFSNNPIYNYDILGDKWKNSNDAAVASNINTAIDKRKTYLDKKASKYESKADKQAAKGNLNKANSLLAKADEQRQGITELTNTQNEIKGLGENTDHVFTFKENTTISFSETYKEADGTIVIEYSSFANAIHELTHAYQEITGQVYLAQGMHGGFYIDLTDEQQSYRRQYFFSPSSIKAIHSDSKTKIRSSMDISQNWISKIWVFHNELATFLYVGFGPAQLNVPGSTADLLKKHHDL